MPRIMARIYWLWIVTDKVINNNWRSLGLHRCRLQRSRSSVLVILGVSDQDVPPRRDPRALQRRHSVLPTTRAPCRSDHGVLGKTEKDRGSRVQPLQRGAIVAVSRRFREFVYFYCQCVYIICVQKCKDHPTIIKYLHYIFIKHEV